MKDTPANRKLVETNIVPKLEKEIREGKIKAPKKQATIKEISEEFLKLKGGFKCEKLYCKRVSSNV